MKLPLVLAALFLAACSGSRVFPPVESTNAVDAGLDGDAPDADVCLSAPVVDDASALLVVGSCAGAVSHSVSACAEYRAAGPFDYAWTAHDDCAKYTGWTWSDGGCPRRGPGGYCSVAYSGPATGCPAVEWDYFYADTSLGLDEVQSEAETCVTGGGAWDAL